MVLDPVWIENAVRARGQSEKKAFIVGLTRLMCESELTASQPVVWGKLLAAAMKVLEDGEESTLSVKDEEETLLDLEQTGYEAGYSKLFFASVAPTDYLMEYAPPRQYLVESLSKFSSVKPGTVRLIFCDI
jgi:exportin-2 (importin alpha re-exporter)